MPIRLSDPKTSPLLHLGALLLGDFVSTLSFAVLFALTRSLAWSVALSAAMGVAGMIWTRRRGRRIDAMQRLSLALVIGFGAWGLLAHDTRVVMIKPSLIYMAVGAVMLKRGWMRRYLPPIALEHGGGVADVFGYVWAAAMLGIAAINLALAAHGDVRLWAVFLGTAPLCLKAGLGLVQYIVTRLHVVRALRRSRVGFVAEGSAGPRVSRRVNAPGGGCAGALEPAACRT